MNSASKIVMMLVAVLVFFSVTSAFAKDDHDLKAPKLVSFNPPEALDIINGDFNRTTAVYEDNVDIGIFNPVVPVGELLPHPVNNKDEFGITNIIVPIGDPFPIPLYDPKLGARKTFHRSAGKRTPK